MTAPSPLYIAATGMVAREFDVSIISGNLANMNTTAFKTQVAANKDLAYQNYSRMGINTGEGASVPNMIQVNLGVKVGGVYSQHSQGGFLPTPEQPYNMAINGKGFFVITLANGRRAYTRDGNFTLDADRNIVTVGDNQNLVTPNIQIPPEALEVAIDRFGVVTARMPDVIEWEELGQLEIATFANPSALEKIGDNLYYETIGSGAEVVGTAATDGVGEIQQGFLETSNVNSIMQMTALVNAQRGFEMCAKVMRTSAEMSKVVNDIRG
jgi:flagellar basal-body rod protein FlgG